jgi:hypothetical protein
MPNAVEGTVCVRVSGVASLTHRLTHLSIAASVTHLLLTLHRAAPQTPTNSYDGYRKQLGPCTSVYASTWSKFGSHAVVAVATWCPDPVNVSLAVDWAALGLDSSTANATLPAISGVQAGQALPTGGAQGPFVLKPNEGLLMLIHAPTFSPLLL